MDSGRINIDIIEPLVKKIHMCLKSVSLSEDLLNGGRQYGARFYLSATARYISNELNYLNTMICHEMRL